MKVATLVVCVASFAVGSSLSLGGFIHDLEEVVEKVGSAVEELGKTIEYGLSYLVPDETPPPPLPKVMDTPATARWMTDMKDTLATIPLNQLVLPGSHDSGTFAITAKSDYANDDPGLNHLAGLPGWLGGDLAKKIVSLWSRTQVADWTTQLQAGARYLDIRVCNMGTALMICHGLQAGKVFDMIDDVAAFHKANPGEIIIVDFNHFYGMDDTTHAALIAKIHDAFGTSIAQWGASLTIDSQAQAFYETPLIIGYDNSYADKDPYLFNDLTYGPWADTTSISGLRSYLVEAIRDRPYKGFGKLFVLQGIRTEDAQTVVNGLLSPNTHPSSLVRMEQTTSIDFLAWVRNSWADCNLNILMVDDFGLYDVVDLAVSLNKRGPLSNPKVLEAPHHRQSADLVDSTTDDDVWAELDRKFKEDPSILDLIRSNVESALVEKEALEAKLKSPIATR